MSNWKVTAGRKGLRPLAVDSSGLLCYSRGALCRVDYDLKNPSFTCNLPIKGVAGHLGKRLRIVDRIFRIQPSHAIIVGDDLFISRRSEIWRCNLTTGQLTLDFVIPDGRYALEFGQIAKSDGEIQLVFGEYFSNPTRKPVRIWGRSDRHARWIVKGEFAADEIEHVHAVTAIGERVFMLCGDFEHAASIWVTDVDFSSMRPLLRGRQAYRAAWIAELGGRLFYATDTQLEPNHVFELSFDGSNGKVRNLADISGSSIYSGQGAGSRYFSTAVESGMPTRNFLRDVFETRRGPGIQSAEAKIMRIDSSGVCEDVFSAEKDFLPFRLAQFGTFTFPSGEMPVDTVVAYGTALRGFDDTCLVLKKGS